MKRRDLFKLIAATVAGWPIRAHGQQATPRHVGVMLGLAKGPDDPGANEILRPLMASMRDMGWAEDKNLRVSTRFGGGERARIDAAADDLVALAPELIYVTGLPPAQALRKRTPTIPIVFSLVADPVGFGLVDSLVVREAMSPGLSFGIFQSEASGFSYCRKSPRTSII